MNQPLPLFCTSSLTHYERGNMAGMISENAKKNQNKPKIYFMVCTQQKIFQKGIKTLRY
jgi:hypothetical protein